VTWFELCDLLQPMQHSAVSGMGANSSDVQLPVSPDRLAWRRRASAATDVTSTGMAVSTVIRGPMPTGRILSITASVAVFSQ
jgi:hypothetical protein